MRVHQYEILALQWCAVYSLNYSAQRAFNTQSHFQPSLAPIKRTLDVLLKLLTDSKQQDLRQTGQ